MIEDKKYPRVLIINGEPFNSSSATGITLSNLFRDWPKDRIAQVYTANIQPNLDLCNRNWKLSNQDLLLFRQINQIRQVIRGKSRDIVVKDSEISNTLLVNKNDLWVGRKILVPFIDLLPYQFSVEFKTWITEYKPDIIYSILGNIRLVKAVQDLSTLFSVPVIPHFMDDWLNTYSLPGTGRFITKFHKKYIQNLTNQVIKRSPIGMSIGDAMSSEYKVKFRRPFEAFMNPVTLEKAPDDKRDDKKISFVYIGGLHLSRSANLLDIGRSISKLQSEGLKVELVVYAPKDDLNEFGNRLSAEGVKIGGTILPEEVHGILSKYHVAVHVESFEPSQISYTRLSVSTKIPQYLAIGLPVLVYGPENVASCRYIDDSKCGIVVGKKGFDDLCVAIKKLVIDADFRRNLGKNGRMIAEERHDEGKVRERFRNTISLAIESVNNLSESM
jgi:glycosyltransferase involved in cell wall biosynthesis